MSNLFDSANYPTREPARLVIGDRWLWKRTDLGATYAPASYSLSYEARRYGDGADVFTITATESGTDYVVEVASTVTDDYQPGEYAWGMFITRTADSERIRLAEGVWTLRRDLAAEDGADPRSHARITLDAIEATIEGRATKDQAAYAIEGRSLSRMPVADLLQFRTHYTHLVNAEFDAQRVRRGERAQNTVRARFR
jgi:hypothetical protein